MADGRPINQVTFQKTQKAHLHPPKGCVCVKNERNPCTGNRVLLRKRNADIRTRDGRTDGRTKSTIVLEHVSIKTKNLYHTKIS